MTENDLYHAAPARSARTKKGPAWRRVLAWVFLLLGLILLPLAVIGGWVRGTVFSTEGFVQTVAPLAAEPAVQQQVAFSVTEQIYGALELEQWLQGVLPERLVFLAGPIEDRLKARTLQAAQQFTASEEFVALWERAVEGSHSAIVSFLNGTGRVQLGEEGVIVLDLSPLATRLVQRLEQAGVEVSGDRFPVATSGKVPIAQVAALEKVRGLLEFLNRLFIVLPILAVLFLAASVAIATRRQRAAVRAGIGMMIATAIFLILILVGRTFFMDATANAGISTDAAGAVWGALTFALRATAWGLFVVGVLLLIHPYIVHAFRGNAMERAAGGAVEWGWDTGPAGRWMARHRILLALAVLVIGFLVLVILDDPPVWAIVVTAVVVIVVDGLIFFVARLGELASRGRAVPPDDTV